MSDLANMIVGLAVLQKEIASGQRIAPERQAEIRAAMAERSKILGRYVRCEPSKVQADSIDFLFLRSDDITIRVPVPNAETDNFAKHLAVLRVIDELTIEALTPEGTS